MAMNLFRIETVITATKGIAVVLSDETPASLEIDGGDVTGLPSDYVLAAGSMLITPSADYIAFTDGVFTQKYNTAPETPLTEG